MSHKPPALINPLDVLAEKRPIETSEYIGIQIQIENIRIRIEAGTLSNQEIDNMYYTLRFMQAVCSMRRAPRLHGVAVKAFNAMHKCVNLTADRGQVYLLLPTQTRNLLKSTYQTLSDMLPRLTYKELVFGHRMAQELAKLTG